MIFVNNKKYQHTITLLSLQRGLVMVSLNVCIIHRGPCTPCTLCTKLNSGFKGFCLSASIKRSAVILLNQCFCFFLTGLAASVCLWCWQTQVHTTDTETQWVGGTIQCYIYFHSGNYLWSGYWDTLSLYYFTLELKCRISLQCFHHCSFYSVNTLTIRLVMMTFEIFGCLGRLF